MGFPSFDSASTYLQHFSTIFAYLTVFTVEPFVIYRPPSLSPLTHSKDLSFFQILVNIYSLHTIFVNFFILNYLNMIASNASHKCMPTMDGLGDQIQGKPSGESMLYMPMHHNNKNNQRETE